MSNITAAQSYLYLCRLITSPDRRLNIEQIKKHPFFYGVDWDTIRQIDAPFVPHLRSITDTSYFPTDDIEQAPAEAPVADANGAQKDLAFLGYAVYSSSFSAGCSHFEIDTPSNDSRFHLMLDDVGLLVNRYQKSFTHVYFMYYTRRTQCTIIFSLSLFWS